VEKFFKIAMVLPHDWREVVSSMYSNYVANARNGTKSTI